MKTFKWHGITMPVKAYLQAHPLCENCLTNGLYRKSEAIYNEKALCKECCKKEQDMKIIKTSAAASAYRSRRATANTGCNICPCCQEPYTGNSLVICETCKGVFNPKHYIQNCYTCRKCGAEWMSEPYTVE